MHNNSCYDSRNKVHRGVEVFDLREGCGGILQGIISMILGSVRPNSGMPHLPTEAAEPRHRQHCTDRNGNTILELVNTKSMNSKKVLYMTERFYF